MKIIKLGSTALIVLLTGCATYGSLEDYWGNSYRTAKSSQIMNPAAAGNTKPPAGLSGKAAENTMKKYVDSFAPNPQGGQQASPSTSAAQPAQN